MEVFGVLLSTMIDLFFILLFCFFFTKIYTFIYDYPISYDTCYCMVLVAQYILYFHRFVIKMVGEGGSSKVGTELS